MIGYMAEAIGGINSKMLRYLEKEPGGTHVAVVKLEDTIQALEDLEIAILNYLETQSRKETPKTVVG